MILSCRVASMDDMKYIVALQNANRESVGHLATPAIQERVERGTLTLAHLDKWPLGYLLYDYRNRIVKIHQSCIQYDARRKLYGAALLWWTLDKMPDKSRVDLRCAADLEANLFWREMGFEAVNTVPGGARRSRLINVWSRWFITPLIQDIAITPAAQFRADCRYDTTDFMDTVPAGFRDGGQLERLAWRNY